MANNLYWRLLCHRDCRYSWSWNKHHYLMIHFSDDKACPAPQLHQWKWAPATGIALSGSFKSLTLPLESLSISPLNFACLLQLENLCRPGSLTACQILQITFLCVWFFFYTHQLQPEWEEQHEENDGGGAALLRFHHYLLVVIRLQKVLVIVMIYLHYGILIVTWGVETNSPQKSK